MGQCGGVRRASLTLASPRRVACSDMDRAHARGNSAALGSLRAGAEGGVECGGHGAASRRGGVCLLHGGDRSGSSPRSAMAWRHRLASSGVNELVSSSSFE